MNHQKSLAVIKNPAWLLCTIVAVLFVPGCAGHRPADKELVLRHDTDGIQLRWTRSPRGWQLAEITQNPSFTAGFGQVSGEYTLLYSPDEPDRAPLSMNWRGNPQGFPEPSYKHVQATWREATSPVAMNTAGQAYHFLPGEAHQTSNRAIFFTAQTAVARVDAEWETDPQFAGDLCVTITLTANRNGYYSIASPTLATIPLHDLDWAIVPGVFAGREFEHDLVLAYAYGQGLPDKPVLARERTASTLASIATNRNGSTLAVIAEPGTSTDPWESAQNSRNEWRLGLSHMNRRGQLSPTLYHPVLGQKDSYLNAGESRKFRFRYSLSMSDWYAALHHAAYDVYRLKDFFPLKRPERSLSARLVSLADYLKDADASRWRLADFNGVMLGAQEYGNKGRSNVVGSDGDAIKNSDYGAMWMLARTSADPLFTQQRIPYARAFKFAQQQTSPGFFQGAAVGQYYLWKSQRFVEEWGTYVEPYALSYYALSDLGNIALFDPADAEARNRLRLGADTLLSWQYPDGHWEVAYDFSSEKPVFTDLRDYRPTFYGMLVAHRVLGDAKYLEAARRGADWLIENAVNPGRYLGVCGDVRFAPDFATAQIAQAMLDLHDVTGDARYRDAGVRATQFYAASVYTHPIASTKSKTVNGKPRADWEISQVGLGFEHGGTIGSANRGGPILLASHAGLFVRVHQLTGDPLLLDLARAGAWARDAMLDPQTQMATYYWSRMDMTGTPYPHHAWWQIGWITDYLVSEATLRSHGKISFPRGFMTPKVGPHAAYGCGPGTVLGRPANLIWGTLKCDRPEIDILLAKSINDNTAFALALNNSSSEIDANIVPNGSVTRLLSPDGKTIPFVANGDACRITLPAYGMTVLEMHSIPD